MATVVFTSLVLWGVDYYKDTDARRIRNRILRQFAAPCDAETTLFEGKPVADLIERTRSGNEAERHRAVLGLSCVHMGDDRFVFARRWHSVSDEERRWMLWLVERGHASHRAAVVLPPLIRALKDPSAEIRTSAVWVLGGMCAAALPACSALRECLKDEDAGVRLASVQALHSIRFETEGLLEVVVNVLQHAPDTGTRARAANSLGRFGFAGSFGETLRSAVPALEAARESEDSELSRTAEEALELISYAEARRSSARRPGADRDH